MSLVKLFKSGVEHLDNENSIALSMLETNMSIFALENEVLAVNGPYFNYLPPLREGLPERIYYTANIIYHKEKEF